MTIPMSDFTALIAQHYPSPRTIIELGALNALDSELFKARFPGARVIAIEGHPQIFADNAPHVPDVIEYYNAVIASECGEGIFYEKTAWGVSGIYDRGSEYGTATSILPTTSLASFCERHDINEITAIKIDIEGATLDALLGMGPLLQTVRIMHIETEAIEYFKGQRLHHEVVRFLVAGGFIPIAMSGLLGQYQYDSVWIRAPKGK